MPIQATEKIWHNGKWINWDDAKLHVLSHVVSYGSSVFEGIRCYETKQGRRSSVYASTCGASSTPRKFIAWSFPSPSSSLQHRLRAGAPEQIEFLLREAHRAARLRRSGVNPLNSPIDIYMACWSWAPILARRLFRKASMSVSAPGRASPEHPSRHVQGRGELHELAAHSHGSHVQRLHRGIALDSQGHVSEGSGMNVFLVHDGVLYTPPLATSILPGITRDAVTKLAEDLRIPVKEHVIPREMLYIADEVFFVGTAVEITPSAPSITSRPARASPDQSPGSSRKSSSPSPAAASPIATTG